MADLLARAFGSSRPDGRLAVLHTLAETAPDEAIATARLKGLLP